MKKKKKKNKKKRTHMIQFSYSSKSRTSTQHPEHEDNLSPAYAHDFEYGVYSRDYDNRTPLHIASPQGWIDVSVHLLIHGWIDMLLLPFMVFGSSSVSPIRTAPPNPTRALIPLTLTWVFAIFCML